MKANQRGLTCHASLCFLWFSAIQSNAERKFELDWSRIRDKKITAENKQKGDIMTISPGLFWWEPTSIIQKLIFKKVNEVLEECR